MLGGRSIAGLNRGRRFVATRHFVDNAGKAVVKFVRFDFGGVLEGRGVKGGLSKKMNRFGGPGSSGYWAQLRNLQFCAMGKKN